MCLLDDDDGAAQTFEWDVQLEDNPGGYYSLRLIQGTQTVDSAPINIIDENGQGATGPPPSATPSPGPLGSATPVVSSAQTDAIRSASASIAATATTDVTTAISGNTITVVPDEATPTGNNASDTATGRSGSSGGDALSGGTIAGIVIGVLSFLTLTALLVFFLIRRHRCSSPPFPNEKGSTNPSYSTPAAFAGLPCSGAVTPGSTERYVKPELHGDNQPLHAQPGVHELSPDTLTMNRPLDTRSSDGSRTGGAGDTVLHSHSEASGFVLSSGNRPSMSEVVGSPAVETQDGASPPTKHTIPRKMVGNRTGQERCQV